MNLIFRNLFTIVHILFWIGYRANYYNMVSADLDWGWYFSFDWPFFGAGLMTPTNTVLSFFIASIFIYGIIGPVSVGNGNFVAPLGFSDKGETTQSFFLWPGIALMVLSSITELLIRYETLWRAAKGGVLESARAIRRGYYWVKFNVFRVPKPADYDPHAGEVPDDQYSQSELVPTWWWAGGLVVCIVYTCAIMGEYFGMPVYQSIVAIICAFLLSFVGIQAAGETDINPIGSIGKMTQLVFARMPADTLQQMQKNNLLAGNIAGSAAGQAVDMVGDLKTGQIVGASPRSQFWAQVVASLPAVGIGVGLFILFADAYPCITDTNLNTNECEFGLVAVTAWLRVAQLLTGAADPLSKACIIVTAICAVLGVVLPVLRTLLIPQKYQSWFPSMSAIGIAMINPQPEVPLSMFIGWSVGKIWKRFAPKHHEDFMYSVAGGMIAGQGISAILQAVFHICGVEGNVFTGSCPIVDGERSC